MKVITLVLLVSQLSDCANVFQKLFEWKALDYAFPSVQDKVKALLTNRFIPENNLPVGIEIWNDKLFVTVPRWRQGIPSTLNYVPLHQDGPLSPLLIPYPSWQHNEAGNCEEGLTTVYRIKADECDRLWVLDTGTFGIDTSTTNPCPYALNVFDLHTNLRLRRYELRKDDIKADTFIANIAVDVRKSCDDTFAYMSDELGYGLIVYSWDLNKSWRFEHSYFMPDPLAGDFNIGGLNFQWGEEGIFGMSLSPIQEDGFRVLYFSPLASNREFAVSTKILRDEIKVEDSYHDFVALEDRGPDSHTTARVMDENGIQFFNLIDRNAVGCWNYKLLYHPTNLGVVDRDDEEMIFPCDVKVDRNRYVWIMTDRMPNFLLSNLNYSDVNFRVFFAPIDRLIHGTPCQPRIDNNYLPLYPQGVNNNGWSIAGRVPYGHPLYGIGYPGVGSSKGNAFPGLYGNRLYPGGSPGYGQYPLGLNGNGQPPLGSSGNGESPIPLPGNGQPSIALPSNGQLPIPLPANGQPKGLLPDNGQLPIIPGNGQLAPGWTGNSLPSAGWSDKGQPPNGWSNKGQPSNGWSDKGQPISGWTNKGQIPQILLDGQGWQDKRPLPGTYYQGLLPNVSGTSTKQQLYFTLLTSKPKVG
ncbi:protein yellow-like [Agrilus planipennis]|uniref:Protein yellow n=1 Tax=Agrilus planipennis TaxID=224129 RepID=A0A1W4XLU4_AGRPL|nr:protein yellow-like [Agrilus planipennis]